MTRRPSAIGGYEDWPTYVRAMGRHPAENTGLARALGVPTVPTDIPVTTVRESISGTVRTSELSWQLGYGPPTRAYFLQPAHAEGPLPAVLLLHCHSGNKWLGAERLVDLGERSSPEAIALREALYDGRAIATDLASRGFAVLAHDTFAWGSRRFKLDPVPERSGRFLAGQEALWRAEGIPETEEKRYNAVAADHENTIAKAAALLGTSFAGMVAHDDLAALNVLRSLPGVDPGRIGTAGLSGGGGRSMITAALSPTVRSHVICCMMTTFDSLLPAYLDAHSWLMHTPGLWSFADWPLIPSTDPVGSSRALLVQYAERDRLFPERGMRDADELLRSRATNDFPYQSSWWDCEHSMTTGMQNEIATFFADTLAPA